MRLGELKEYINSIPEDMDNYTVVNGELGMAKDGNTFVMTNNEVHTAYVDVKNGEVQFLHQSDKDVKDLILGLDGDTEKH
jgi:tricorn protease-like protein